MIGRTLGHYRILRELGKGGMGTVYLAEDSSLGRQVALKVLPEDVARDAVRLERFEREARTVASFNHPNIVTLHSVEEADGVRFLTMEYVEGETLARLIPAGGMPLPDFFEVAIPLADALAAAHQGGITHRDLKPANVMVTTDGRVKVLDFGLAKPAAPSSGPDAETMVAAEALTQEGALVGTVAYMSPEQIECGPVDARSDIFSLGVLLYQMATGGHPFAGESQASLVASILKDHPRPVLEVKEGLPRQLARLVHHCLEKDPDRRFQSALDLRNQLADLREEEETPSSVVSKPVAEPSPGPAPRRRRLGIAVAAAAIAVAMLAVWLGSRVRPGAGPGGEEDGDRRMVVVLPFENLGSAEDEYFAAGIAEEITARLASVSGLGVISRNSARRYAGTSKTIREIGAELGVGYVLDGTVRWTRSGDKSRVRITPHLVRVADDRQLWSEPYDEVLEDIFELQSDIAGRVIDRLGVTLLDRERQAIDARPTENLEAYQAYLRGQDTTGRRTYSREDRLLEVEMFQRAVELDPGFALAWAALSKAHSELVNLGYDMTPERIQAAKAAVDRALEIDPELPEGHLALAYYHYWARRDYESALAALAVAERGLPDHQEILLGRAWITRRLGGWQEAIRLVERAFRLSPLESRLPRELGVMYLNTRQPRKAIEALDRSIALAPDQQAAYVIKALVHWTTGDLAAAREVIDRVPGEASPLTGYFATSQAVLERDWVTAEELIAGFPEGLVVVTPDVIIARSLLQAAVELARGRPETARALARETLPLVEARLAETPEDPRLHGMRGWILACLGRGEDALAAGRRAVDLYPLSRDALHGSRQHLDLAIIAGMIGDTATAREQLEILLSSQTWITPAYVRLAPSFDPVRRSPELETLLAAYE